MEVLFLIFVFLTLAFDIVIFTDLEHLVDNTLDIDKDLEHLVDNTLDIDKELRRIKKGGKR